MNRLNNLIGWFSPKRALAREVASAQRRMLVGSHYDATGGGRRTADFRKNNSDAMMAMRADRGPLTMIARDMLRNNPRVVRANNLFANYTVGSGIIPTIKMVDRDDKKTKERLEGFITDHLMTTAIDADGHNNLFGLQALAMSTIPASGECLLRRRMRKSTDGFPLPFQIQILEPDYLNDQIDGKMSTGNKIEQGIEYDLIGRVAAYHMFQSHPGGRWGAQKTTRVDPKHIIHTFHVTRPGQRRGVSWYAPVIPLLHDLQKFMDASLKRQEMAAMFAGILKTSGTEKFDDPIAALEAGTIMEIGGEDDLTFNDPPKVDSVEPLIKQIDRTIAACLMLPYEGFSGNYSDLNYSGGRMARMDTDPSVARWQHHIMIAQQLNRIGDWFKEAVYDLTFIDPDSYAIHWTPQQRPVVDPTKDYPSMREKRKAGLTSRRALIREMGGDPAKIEAEILEETLWARENNLAFSSDGKDASGGPDKTGMKGK